MKLDVHVKSGQLRDLLTEFIEKDLLQLVLGTSFMEHSFRALWQYSQYVELKNTLKTDEVLLVMDFAENRKAMYNEEVKTAHFGKGQITLHPVVAFYRNTDAQLVRHSLMFITDDIQHDYHAVHAFTVKAIDFFLNVFSFSTSHNASPTFFIFSDGCAAQYKGKGAFADLSLSSTVRFERLFFGSEHGKGEADGETGVLSQAMKRAVHGNRIVIKDAADLYNWGMKEMARNEPLFKRDFFLIGDKEIKRDRPETDVATLPGTRRIHHLKRVQDYIVQARYLACFCPECRSLNFSSCLNIQHVGAFDTFKLKPRQSDPTLSQPGSSCLDEAFLESPEVLPTKRTVPKIGDFLRLVFKVGKKELSFTALVIETTVKLKKNEIMVSYMKDYGSYFIFPAKEDKSLISLNDSDLVNLSILEAPIIDNRNRHFFS